MLDSLIGERDEQSIGSVRVIVNRAARTRRALTTCEGNTRGQKKKREISHEWNDLRYGQEEAMATD
jgi:hypothetical protein